jgi:hypothetical protein
MSELQLGLLVIGVAAVVAVLVYNRVQERGVGRAAQRAFGSLHTDALLDEPADDRRAAAKTVIRKGDWHIDGLPDVRVDYVVELEITRGTLSATVLENWKTLEHRFAGRALLVGSDGGRWDHVVAGDVRSLTALRAALQMVNRSGVASDAELLEFRSAAEALGAALGAKVAAPEMREALEAARALDKLCADADIQVALHVVGEGSRESARIANTVGSEDLPFHVEERADGVSFILDVPRTAQPHGFESMSRAARRVAAASAGSVVDDNGHELDERALAAIGAEVDAVRARLAASGIEPGSPLALRLFS